MRSRIDANNLQETATLAIWNVTALERETTLTGGGSGQIERVVEFAVGQESGIAGDLGPEEAEPETAVELRPQRLGRTVTHDVGSANGQEVVRNTGNRRVPAQLSCRFRLSSGKSGF